jgi:hypothetical protein
MNSRKFDEHDRKKVISEVEDHFAIHLSPVGSRRKFLEDEEGKTYWVLGGYDDWHGIPLEMMEEEDRRSTNGVLVVAKRYKTQIDIYFGPLQPLIRNKDMLSHTENGDFQFNINLHGNHLFIKEVKGLSLAKLGEAPYSGEEKDSDKKIQDFKAMLSKLSPDEQKEFLEKLAKELEA